MDGWIPLARALTVTVGPASSYDNLVEMGNSLL